jgi:2-iminobutanoate/2-iminopropanoate deaminase
VKKVITTTDAPAAIGPYSQAILAGDMLFASGQIPLDPKTGQLVEGSVEVQAERVLENVKAIVGAAGFSMEEVVKTTVFAAGLEHFAAINGVYARYFKENPPARSFVPVKELPRGALVEIEVIAKKS